MKANELKKGMVVTVDGQTILIQQIQVQSPSSRSGSTLYKAKGRNVVSRTKFERNFKGDDHLESVEFLRRAVQFLYRDSDGCTFMDKETYEQYVLSDSAVEEELPYISDGLDGLYALIANDTLLGIELPPSVILAITDCAPGIKGASASARSKPATLSTGLTVQVPEYIEVGEVIKINTETGEYISRA